MLSLPVAVRIFVFTGVTDMRRSLDGFAAMVENELDQSPESGHLFLFFNRRHDRVKILFWQGDGLVLWYKRLECSVFPSLCAASHDPMKNRRWRFAPANWRCCSTASIRARLRDTSGFIVWLARAMIFRGQPFPYEWRAQEYFFPLEFLGIIVYL